MLFFAPVPHCDRLHFPIFKISQKQQPGTWKRRDRRRRATARRQWYLHKTGKISLTAESLIRVRNIFSKHHSRDSAFLHKISCQIQEKMSAEEAYPWVCPCGRLNKKSANLCALCWGHWSKGTKHDVTPKKNSYGASTQWHGSWDGWNQEWTGWEQDWDDTESVGHSSTSSRGRQVQQIEYSPRGRIQREGKGQRQGQRKDKERAKHQSLRCRKRWARAAACLALMDQSRCWFLAVSGGSIQQKQYHAGDGNASASCIQRFRSAGGCSGLSGESRQGIQPQQYQISASCYKEPGSCPEGAERRSQRQERPSSPVDKTRWRGHQDLGSPAGQLQGPSSYSPPSMPPERDRR